ncbi:MAG: hypothetical protein WCI05_01195 [Myxococcales bacterium]
MNQSDIAGKLEHVLRHARQNSPFYRQSYAHLAEDETRLERFPILDHTAFWNANGLENNTVLTGPLLEGVVFKSGGTTGNPKFSPYTREEWRLKTHYMGMGFAKAGVHPGDRVANLFRGGDLYASLLSMGTAMLACSCPVVTYPIGDFIGIEAIVAAIEVHRLTVLAGIPSSLLKVAEYLARTGKAGTLAVRSVLFAGESLYPDQQLLLADVFQGAAIRTLGYASVDGGAIGYADDACGPNEFKPFEEHMVVEIVSDEDHRPVSEVGVPGRILLTNLDRWLMPIVRYPAGDRAEWVTLGTERRFRLLGRSDEGARVGLVTLYIEDLRKVLAPFWQELRLIDFQLLLRHMERKDQLTLRLSSLTSESTRKPFEERIRAQLFVARPELKHAVDAGAVHPVAFEWVGSDGLEVVERTGKLRRVVDERRLGA